MNLAEGVETGLSLQQINGAATIASMSTGIMRVLKLPPLPLAAKVTIGSDNDEPGWATARTAQERWVEEGPEASIAVPADYKDRNDVLRANPGRVASATLRNEVKC
jgi:hypothetical protein